MKNLYWKNPAFKDTTDFDHIKVGCGTGLEGQALLISEEADLCIFFKVHYYSSHPQINPTRIVPVSYFILSWQVSHLNTGL
jgi:putative glutathione S-transferase